MTIDSRHSPVLVWDMVGPVGIRVRGCNCGCACVRVGACVWTCVCVVDRARVSLVPVDTILFCEFELYVQEKTAFVGRKLQTPIKLSYLVVVGHLNYFRWQGHFGRHG